MPLATPTIRAVTRIETPSVRHTRMRARFSSEREACAGDTRVGGRDRIHESLSVRGMFWVCRKSAPEGRTAATDTWLADGKLQTLRRYGPAIASKESAAELMAAVCGAGARLLARTEAASRVDYATDRLGHCMGLRKIANAGRPYTSRIAVGGSPPAGPRLWTVRGRKQGGFRGSPKLSLLLSEAWVARAAWSRIDPASAEPGAPTEPETTPRACRRHSHWTCV